MWWVPLLRRCHTVRPWPWQQWLGNQIIKHNHIILIMAFQSFKSTVEEGVRGSSEVLMGSFITANPLLLPPHLPWPDISSSGPSISCFRCVQVVDFFLEILILLQFVLGITTFMLVYLSEVLRKESPILLGIRWWYHLASACHGVSYAEPYKHCPVNSFSSIVKQYTSEEDSTGYPQLDAQSHISGCWPFFF